MYAAVSLITIMLVSYLFMMFTRRFSISVVVGLVVAGIILGSPAISDAVLEPNTDLIFMLGDIGVVSLMFLAGMEVSWREFCKEERDAAIISVSATITPLLIGFLVFLAIGFPLLTSLTVGICMSITAEATNARVLIEMKKLRTKIGSLMMGAGIIDDVMGIAMFAVVGYLFTKSFMTSEVMLIFLAIMAFFFGIATHRLIGREKHVIPYMEKALMVLIVPFFFVAMGIHFSLQTLSLNILLLVLVVAIAITGKILGVLVTKPLTDLKLRQLYLVGWGMNSRGAVELAIAFVALKIGLFDTSIYTSLVVMAVVTTVIFPFFIRNIIKKEPGIME
jgi:Kef-type K+ transport system membrane component KefB